VKTSIYLPDELAEQVRAHDISISAVAQTALRKAVNAAQFQQRAIIDIEAVAARLRGTVDDEDRQQFEDGHTDGLAWARNLATVTELRNLAQEPDGRFLELRGHTLVELLRTQQSIDTDSATVDNEDPYWKGFRTAATEVWEAVQPLL
jgi:post-segregation antitoxin (ccd killing protein)